MELRLAFFKLCFVLLQVRLFVDEFILFHCTNTCCDLVLLRLQNLVCNLCFAQNGDKPVEV